MIQQPMHQQNGNSGVWPKDHATHSVHNVYQLHTIRSFASPLTNSRAIS